MKKGEKMNSKLLSAGGSIKKCRDPSVSLLFSSWKKNKRETEFKSFFKTFTKCDLANWRRNRGWTQPDMADWCGKGLRWIQKLEYGEIAIPELLARAIFFYEDE